jgi:hypothetical protein
VPTSVSPGKTIAFRSELPFLDFRVARLANFVDARSPKSSYKSVISPHPAVWRIPPWLG